MNCSNEMGKIAKEWAKEQALTEEEAFEWAIKSNSIKKTDFDIDDKYEQAYRQGIADQLKSTEKVIAENAELRHQLRAMEDMNRRLREAILRGFDEEWD